MRERESRGARAVEMSVGAELANSAVQLDGKSTPNTVRAPGAERRPAHQSQQPHLSLCVFLSPSAVCSL
eukprot:COSAG01_NODE_37701_length_500_cov_0.518703_1_plen_68_part_10